MAKPTDEVLALPEVKTALVQLKDGELVTEQTSLKELHEQANKGLIVYFYPRDNTPGCSTQAQDFTAMKSQFADIGYDIVGISRDSATSHENFITKKELNIPLLSDAEEALCQHFDVIKEKNMYGKKTLGLVRSTFVFDKAGKLTHAQRNLRAKGYAERLLATLSNV